MRRREFDRLVRVAVRRIPRDFRRWLDNVVIAVEDEPDPDLLDDSGEDDLLGIYLGTPLTERGSDELFHMPDQILIFQRPIEAMCATREEIIEQIRITVVHEIAHHFGLSEEEIVAVLGE